MVLTGWSPNQSTLAFKAAINLNYEPLAVTGQFPRHTVNQERFASVSAADSMKLSQPSENAKGAII